MRDTFQNDPAGLLLEALFNAIGDASEATNDRASIVSLCMELKHTLDATMTVVRHHPSLGPGASDHRHPLGIDLDKIGRG